MKTTTDQYNDSYRKFTPDWFDKTDEVTRYLNENSESLVGFFNSYNKQFQKFPKHVMQNMTLLDTGCGLGSTAFAMAKKGATVSGVDISSLAIVGAKSIAKDREVWIDFFTADVSQKGASFGEYDIIVDSHLFHCLTSDEQRKNYLDFVFRSLKPNGHFFLETMVYHHHIDIPMDYHLDENMVLHKFSKTQNEFIPIRMLKETMQIEEEIKSAGLEINYYYYHAELSFDVFTEYKNHSHLHLPHTIRTVAIKKAD